MTTVCDMVKLEFGIVTTVLQQHFQYLMTQFCRHSRQQILCILFVSKVAVYHLCTTNIHHHLYWGKNQVPGLLPTSNAIAPVQLNPTFFIQIFYLMKIRKVPLFQSSPVSPQACSPAILTSIYFQRGTRFKGEKKSNTNQVTASMRSKESQHGIIKAGLAQEPSVRTIGQNFLFFLMPSPKSAHPSPKFTVGPIRLEGWFK